MFPFKYKLTLLFAFIIILLLTGSFLTIQIRLNSEYAVTIENQLASTKKIIQEQMSIRKNRLIDFVKMLENNNLIKITLRDSSLDRVTRNDIVEGEILSNFSAINYMLIIDGGGNILAGNLLANESEVEIRDTSLYQNAVMGKRSSGYFLYNDIIIQLISQPIYDIDVLTGVLIIGFIIDESFIDNINEIYGINIGFLEQNKIIKKNSWDENLERQGIIESDLLSIIPSLNDGKLVLAHYFTSSKERFIYTLSDNKDSFIPQYVLLKSLDKSLEFVKTIRDNLIFISIAAVLIGLLISLLFSLSITQPIHKLQTAAVELEKENYNFRVDIKTNDEFSNLGKSFNEMISSIGEKEKIRSVLNKSVSKEIAEELLKGKIQLGGDEKEATILFTDVRDFTSISEGLSPSILLNILNEYLTNVSLCIEDNKGVIDKYIGDAVMALFGLPLPLENDAEAGILSALAISRTVEEFNKSIAGKIGKEFKVGIGLSTGLVVAGNMGAKNRMNYTVLGDEVNLASRIESLTKYYKTNILLSQSTYEKVSEKNLFVLRQVDTVRVKGKQNGVTIYDVLTDDDEELAEQFTVFHQTLQKKQFMDALDILQSLTKKYPDDGPVKVFTERVKRYIKDNSLFDREYEDSSFIFLKK